MGIKSFFDHIFKKETPHVEPPLKVVKPTLDKRGNPLLGKWNFLGGDNYLTIEFTEDTCIFYFCNGDAIPFEYDYSITEDSFIVNDDDDSNKEEYKYKLINNLLVWYMFDDCPNINFRDGEIPNFENEYSDMLLGYYKNSFNDYYHFGRNGILENIMLGHIQYNYYYVADKDRIYVVMLCTDAQYYRGANYKIVDKKVEMQKSSTLVPITKEEYDSNKMEKITHINSEYSLLVLVEETPLYLSPSFKADSIDCAFKYDVLGLQGISIVSEGCTWYKTIYDSWFPNKEGRYAYFLKYKESENK